MNWRLISFLSVTIILFLFNNCQRGFKISSNELENYELSSLYYDDGIWPEVQCSSSNQKLLPQVEKKTELRGLMSEELKNSWIDETNDLLVIIDNECFLQKKSSSIFTEELENLTPNSSKTTFKFPIYESISGQEIYHELINDSCIVQIDLDQKMKLFTPNDPRYPEQRYLNVVNHSITHSIAYNPSNGIKKDVIVAVIDSGVDVNHPDLRDAILKDATGKIIGLNAIDNTNNVSDSGFHGTHVTGIIGAIGNNGEGISGIANRFIKIIPIQVSNDGSSVNLSALINGIYWAVDQGAKVINLSLGGPNRSEALLSAIRYAESKGVLIVAASGNNGLELFDTPGRTIYPAMFTTEVSNMITVGSIDAMSNQLSSFSNFSGKFVDILAPGSNGSSGILSTVPTNLSSPPYRATGTNQQGVTIPIQGTSMAAPLVAGAAAMIIGLAESRGFSINPEQIKKFFNIGSLKNFNLSNRSVEGKTLNLYQLLSTVALDTGLDLHSNLPLSQMAGVIKIKSHTPSMGLPSGSPLKIVMEKTEDSSILVHYKWYKNGTLIPEVNGSELSFNSLTEQDRGIYVGEISSGKTIRRTNYIKVNVKQCL